MICEAWDIIAVPFPFTDRAAHKRRPALVLSSRTFNQHGHTLLAMIASSSFPWPGGRSIKDLVSAGLSTPCVVRLKLFTLDNRLMIRRIGHLAPEDRNHVIVELQTILPL